MGESWLLRAALERRQQDVIESRGRDLTTDACDNGGRLRHRLSMRAAPRTEAPRIVLSHPIQLDLWSAA